MEQVCKPVQDYLKGEFGYFKDKDGESYIIFKNKYSFYELFNNISLGRIVNDDVPFREFNRCGHAIALSVKSYEDFKTLQFKTSKIYTKWEHIFSDLNHLILTEIPFKNVGIFSSPMKSTDDFPNIEDASLITTNEALKEYVKRKGYTKGKIILKDPFQSSKDKLVEGLLFMNEENGIIYFAHNDSNFNGCLKYIGGYKYSWSLTANDEIWWADFRPSKTIESKPIRGIASTLAEEEERYRRRVQLDNERFRQFERDRQAALQIGVQIHHPASLYHTFKKDKESDFQNPVIISTKQTKNKLL